MPEITKIVITGGPCAGKSTGMNYLIEKLSDMGYKVFVVPEAATQIIVGGFDPADATSEQFLGFEEEIIRLQIEHEKTFERLALESSAEKIVILLDRGIMDTMAYIGNEEFLKILNGFGLTTVTARDNRYDAVIHLRTAALGAEDFYTCENNKARRETIPQAIEMDKATEDAWGGVNHLKVIDNSSDFEGKIQRVFQATCRVLGIPVPKEIEKKYLVDKVIWEELPHYQVIDIEQVYLLSEDGETRIRKRGQDGEFCYFLTHKETTSKPGIRIETEKRIFRAEYLRELKHADPLRLPVIKKRYCFVWNSQYFELDVLEKPIRHKGEIYLEIELTEENDKVELPPFIKIKKEVTGDPTYNNYNLALK